MTRLYTSIIACLLLVSGAIAQTQGPGSYNTTLFGQIDPGSSSSFGRYSALTGYAAPDGREYALLGGYTGTHIIDVTEQPIHQVAFIPGPPNGWREMKTYDHYAYVISEGGAGLQIIDLSNLPASATLVRADSSNFRTAHTITQHGKFLYVNGSGVASGANGGTMIFDLSGDPAHPVRIGTWMYRYVHDCTVRNDTLYAAAINDGVLDIVYLGSDQTSPQLVTTIEYPGGGTHNSDLTPDGSYVMTTDEVGATPKTLKVWDVRDVDNITKVADWTPAPEEIIHNVHMRGSIAYISWYTAGTRIVDMSDPADPAELGFYDTYPGASHDYAGNWGVYPYLPSGKILASDMQTGLYVFTFNGTRRGNVHGFVRDAETGEPVPGATIEFPETGRTIVSDAAGRYSLSGAVDTLGFRATGMDYIMTSGELILAETGNEADIIITPLPTADLTIVLVDDETDQEIPTFAYHVVERTMASGTTQSTDHIFRLPKDSTYHIEVGAWGYLPRMVTITGNAGGERRVRMQRGYADDAELDLGWSLAAPEDNAQGGRWERGVPIETVLPDGTLLQPGHDHTGGLGNQAFITGIAGSEAGPGANDVDDGMTTLTSPPMDLSGYDNPILTCAIWYSRDGRFDAINDTLEVLISGDGGGSWKTLARIVESPQIWREYRFRLKDFIPPSQGTLFRIVASDLYAQSVVEAGLDEFAVADSGKPLSAVPIAPGAGSVVRFHQLRPNPIAGTAHLELDLAADQRHARLELFDVSGSRVALLHEGRIMAGPVSFAIDGAALPAGTYTWRLMLDDGASVTGRAAVVR